MKEYQNQIDVSYLPEIEVDSLPEYINLVCQISERWRTYIGPIDFVDSETEIDIDDIQDVREPFPGEIIPWFRGNIPIAIEN